MPRTHRQTDRPSRAGIRANWAHRGRAGCSRCRHPPTTRTQCPPPQCCSWDRPLWAAASAQHDDTAPTRVADLLCHDSAHQRGGGGGRDGRGLPCMTSPAMCSTAAPDRRRRTADWKRRGQHGRPPARTRPDSRPTPRRGTATSACTACIQFASVKSPALGPPRAAHTACRRACRATPPGRSRSAARCRRSQTPPQ